MKKLLKATALGVAIIAAPGVLMAETVTETRDVDTFTRIVVESSADVLVDVGGTQRVEVKADDDLMPYIETEVRNGTLYVSQDAPRKVWRHNRHGVSLKIQVANLEGVTVDGSGDISVSNVDSDTFEILIDGSGDVDLDGTCGDLTIEVDGSGDIDSHDMQCKTADVDIDGSGDVDVFASDSVKLEIRGSGDVTVYGDPDNVRPTIRGSGELDFRDGK